MKVKHGSVFFELTEVQQFLPEKLAMYGYTLAEIIGKNSYMSFKVDGSNEVSFMTTEDGILISVTPNQFYSHDSLSSLVAECERILKSATESGVFRELEMAVVVVLQLQSYFERLAQRVVNRTNADIWAAIRSLQAKLPQGQ
jgi:hypothetical protein